jgi:hypothetical protein
MTCWGWEHLHRIDDVGSELARDDDGLVERYRIGRGSRQHDAAIDGGNAQTASGNAVELERETRDVVGYFNIEDSYRPAALSVHRHPRHADLLAENGERMVSERRHVGHFRIADHDIRERRIDADVLCLARGDGDRRCSPRGAQRDQTLLRPALH